MVICKICSKELDGRCQKCPFCNTWLRTPATGGLYERNKKIVDLIDSTDLTLQAVGDMQDPRVSRERIRQIYKATTGNVYGRRNCYKRMLKNAKEKKLSDEEKNRTIKFTCKCCKKEVTWQDRHNGSVYCKRCGFLVSNLHVDPSHLCTCINCGIDFFPPRNWEFYQKKKGHGPMFHNRVCFKEFLVKHGVSGRTLDRFLREGGYYSKFTVKTSLGSFD